MNPDIKKKLDQAVDALKGGGYMVLIVMLDQRERGCTCTSMLGPSEHCEAHGRNRPGVEVLCSETNDPQLLGAMLKTTLEQLTSQSADDRQIN